MKVAPYHASVVKRLFDLCISVFLLFILSPLFTILILIVYIFTGLPVFFIQKRVGKNGRVFQILKFRTMVKGSESAQYKYKKFNEADGPVFKIFNDPRFTPIGKILSRYGLDELPQLLNVIKGDMSLVGPRPLPINEAKKLSKNQKMRELIKPGVTSLWVIEGQHNLSFEKWMQLDRKYVQDASFCLDCQILLRTIKIILS